MYAEIGERVRGNREAGFFKEFSGSGGGQGFPRFRHSFWDVPARRARRMTEQYPLPVRDDHAAARPAWRHGRVPPAETPP